MGAVPLSRAGVGVLPYSRFLNRIGAPVERFLNRAHLPSGALEDPEKLVPFINTLALAEVAAQAEGVENLGIIVAQQTQVAQLGAVGLLLCQSLTLHDLLNKLLTLHPGAISGEQIWLTDQGDSCWLHHRYTVPQSIQTYQAQYYSVLMYLSVIRLAAGSDWQPEELHLSGPYQQKGFLELDFLVHTPIQFHQPSNAIRFPQALLSKPLIHQTRLSLSGITEAAFQQTASPTSFPDSLSQLIRCLLPEGYPNITIAADAAGMSVRTFQRRLEDNHLSYSDLIDQIRFERAIELMQDTSMKLIDVAYELGYAEPANFTKAFKRWTGVSPRKFRNLHLKTG
jgi:AraC-like DNA-binding protein